MTSSPVGLHSHIINLNSQECNLTSNVSIAYLYHDVQSSHSVSHPYIRRTKVSKVLNNRKKYKCIHIFTRTNNMASSGLLKMLCVIIFILTTGSTHCCVMSDTWCQSVWHQNDDAGTALPT